MSGIRNADCGLPYQHQPHDIYHCEMNTKGFLTHDRHTRHDSVGFRLTPACSKKGCNGPKVLFDLYHIALNGVETKIQARLQAENSRSFSSQYRQLMNNAWESRENISYVAKNVAPVTGSSSEGCGAPLQILRHFDQTSIKEDQCSKLQCDGKLREQ